MTVREITYSTLTVIRRAQASVRYRDVQLSGYVGDFDSGQVTVDATKHDTGVPQMLEPDVRDLTRKRGYIASRKEFTCSLGHYRSLVGADAIVLPEEDRPGEVTGFHGIGIDNENVAQTEESQTFHDFIAQSSRSSHHGTERGHASVGINRVLQAGKFELSVQHHKGYWLL
ncbi:MAG: hypothetical protein ABSH50_31375 [Bryobacteraceae bacterium]|jgi:hypothetical protein